MLKCSDCKCEMVLDDDKNFYVCSNCGKYPSGRRGCDYNYDGTMPPNCNLKCNGFCIIKCNENNAGCCGS